MLRIIFVGVWICVVALGTFIFALRYSTTPVSASSEAQDNAQLDYKRTKILDIPIILDNELKGYIIAQFVYIIDHKAANVLGDTILADYINDAVFEKFYGTYTSATQIDKVDVNALKADLVKKVNSRFPEPYLKELIIAHFTYYTRDKLKKSGIINLPKIN